MFAGLSCSLVKPPKMLGTEVERSNELVPIAEQYHIARAKLRRYNFVVISEMLRHPKYVEAVERFFGVPGVAQRKYSPWCAAESHYTNEMFPLVIKPDTLNKLKARNRLDIQLYKEFNDCLANSDFDFPSWKGHRFETNTTIQLDYVRWEERNPTFWPTTPKQIWLDKFNLTTDIGL